MITQGRSRAQCRLMGFAVLLGVFLLGGLAGAVSYRAYRARTVAAKPEPFWTEAGRAHSLQKWKQELNLTPEQEREIESILDDFTMYYRSVLSDGRTKILTILNDVQRKKFEKMVLDSSAR
jgi:uncharacterized membrane protein